LRQNRNFFGDWKPKLQSRRIQGFEDAQVGLTAIDFQSSARNEVIPAPEDRTISIDGQAHVCAVDDDSAHALSQIRMGCRVVLRIVISALHVLDILKFQAQLQVMAPYMVTRNVSPLASIRLAGTLPLFTSGGSRQPKEQHADEQEEKSPPMPGIMRPSAQRKRAGF
jgi:hypothetical protein